VNQHFDSMTSHDDLVHSLDVDGGYRVSTAVTAPGAGCVPLNASATVHINAALARLTLDSSGLASIIIVGPNVSLPAGPCMARSAV